MRQAQRQPDRTDRGPRALRRHPAGARHGYADQGIENGLLTLFVHHTSASLLIQENADPAVLDDLNAFFRRVVPEDAPYRHSQEGPDDMPAHIRAALTATHFSIPVEDGRMELGRWQGISCSSTAPGPTSGRSRSISWEIDTVLSYSWLKYPEVVVVEPEPEIVE